MEKRAYAKQLFLHKKTMRFSIVIFSILLSIQVYSQAQLSTNSGIMYINKNQTSGSSLDGKRGGYFGQHYLGDTITMAYDKFLKYYVKYESTGGAYASEKKVIYKTPIYNAVQKIDKEMKKLVKTHAISREDGKNRLGAVLNSAIEIRFYDTSQFESILDQHMKDTERIERYFNALVIQ